MAVGFIRNSGQRSAKKKVTYSRHHKPTLMMSGALPSPPEDENATSTRKDATNLEINATPPSAQQPPASLDEIEDDDFVRSSSQPIKAAVSSERNAFTVLASSQARLSKANAPAGRTPNVKWTAEEEWVVIEGIRDGLSQAQILINLLPAERSASAIRGKKMDLQAKYGEKLEHMSEKKRNSAPFSQISAPPMPPRKPWTADESAKLRRHMREGLSDRDIQALHFPNRTEDSVIGKIRKVRAKETRRLARNSQYASSSPAHKTSSQTAARSSPAQAALKRKYLADVQEEEATPEDFEPLKSTVPEESVLSEVDDLVISATPEPETAMPPPARPTAYVVVPPRPDLSDVVDLREGALPGALVPNRALVDDQEAKYAATPPPFRPGQEHDKVGIFHATKLGLWREAYSRCRGDFHAAYRRYENLAMDEHMLQAVCNQDYEIINGIKAMRMRKAREDALREGMSPPSTPVPDQPQHLDLFEEKTYGPHYSYKSWPTGVEEMYLNEPIAFAPRPVPGVPIDYPDPMQEAMRDDGDEGDYDEEDGGNSFHGHISEIDESDTVSRKRKHSPESMPPLVSKKQNRKGKRQRTTEKKKRQSGSAAEKTEKPKKPAKVRGVKEGMPGSLAVVRRKRLHLRRSDASVTSEATSGLSKSVSLAERVKQETPEDVKPVAQPKMLIAKVETPHPEDDPSQWMREIVKNAKHKPPPVYPKSPPPIDPNNLFGRGDPSDSSSSESDSD